MSPFVLFAQNGPGGIGTKDKSSDLVLWLRADQAVNLSRNCYAVDDGEPVNKWTDLSGKRLSFEQPKDQHRPQWQKAGINGRPSLKFTRADKDFLKAEAFKGLEGKENYSLFLVADLPPRDGQILFSGVRATDGKRGKTGLYIAKPKDNFHPNQNGDANFRFTHRSPFRLSQESGVNVYTTMEEGSQNEGPRVMSFVKNGRQNQQSIRINSRDVAQKTIENNANQPFSSPLDLTIGTLADWMNSMNLHGQIGEVIVFNRALSKPESRIVEQYLQRRYELGRSGEKLAANSVKGISGIGHEEGQSVESLKTGGITIKDLSFLRDTSKYLFAGYDNKSHGTQYLQGINFAQASEKAWWLNFKPSKMKDSDGDLAFEFAYSSNEEAPGNEEDYRLLFKQKDDASFEVIDVKPAIMGQIMEFQLNVMELKELLPNSKGWIYLATRDPEESPLPEIANPGGIKPEFDQAFSIPE